MKAGRRTGQDGFRRWRAAASRPPRLRSQFPRRWRGSILHAANSHQWDSPRGKCRLPADLHSEGRACSCDLGLPGGRTGAQAASPMETPGRHRVPSTPRGEPAPPAACHRGGAGEMPRGAGAARGEGKGFSRDWARFPVL